MIKKTYGALALSLLLGLSSCSDEAPWAGSDTKGGISLELSTDGRVMRETRADNSVSPEVPDVESFGVTLKSTDGSFSKDWASVEAFNHESGFSIGDYVLSAHYGDVNQEGFTNPYFYGQTPVSVSPGSESEATIVATLANAMVTIKYSDKFKSNFSAYSAAVQTDGHEWVVFTQNEERPAYIAPSDVKLNLTLTNFAGKQVTIQPAGFQAQPRHHYLVTIDADDSSGELLLNVIFDDEVVNETVNVSLGDDLFNAPEPTVTTKGFDNGQTITGFEFLTELPNATFNIFALGGLKDVNLNLISDNNYAAAFGKSAQLVNASDLLQQQLASEGIQCVSLFKNVDKMGMVTVTDFLKKLPAGNYTIEVSAVDRMTRVSETARLVLNLNKVQLAFLNPAAIDYGATEITVDVTTNCQDIKDVITFKAPDANNRMVEVPVKSVSEVSGGTLAYTFRYVLTVAPQTGKEADVYGIFGNENIYTKVPINQPDLKVETDAFAKSVVVRLSGSAVSSESVINNISFYDGGKAIPAANLIYNASSKQVTIAGLEPNKQYNNLSLKLGNYDVAIPSFVTEQATDVTNGDFSSLGNKISKNPINSGGEYRITFTLFTNTYFNKSSINLDTPADWATLNPLTYYENSTNVNTWYMVPSTWVDNGQAVIQTVGYSHDGKVLAESHQSNTTYYSVISPELSDLNVTSGELFLGSYSFDGTEHRVNGITWNSRPSTLSFDYEYEPQGNEKGEVNIKVYGKDNQVISSSVVALSAASEMTTKTVALTNYPFGNKASRIELSFKSTQSGTTPSVNIPTGSQLSESEVTALNFTSSNTRITANKYRAVARGSKLTIDNVKLGYDPKAAAAASVKRKSSNKKR